MDETLMLMQMNSLLSIVGLAILFIFVYFLPSYIVIKKNKSSAWIVVSLNIFLGFTPVWLVLLIYAIMTEKVAKETKVS